MDTAKNHGGTSEVLKIPTLLPTLSLGLILVVPHSQSGAVPMSSLLGVGQLGFWEVGKGGTTG